MQIDTKPYTIAPNSFIWGNTTVELPEGYEGTNLITMDSPNGVFVATATGYGNGRIEYGLYNTRTVELTESKLIINMIIIKKGLNIYENLSTG